MYVEMNIQGIKDNGGRSEFIYWYESLSRDSAFNVAAQEDRKNSNGWNIDQKMAHTEKTRNANPSLD